MIFKRICMSLYKCDAYFQLGLYMCRDDQGFGEDAAVAELIVLGREINCVYYSVDSELQCVVNFRGNEKPRIDWSTADNTTLKYLPFRFASRHNNEVERISQSAHCTASLVADKTQPLDLILTDLSSNRSTIEIDVVLNCTTSSGSFEVDRARTTITRSVGRPLLADVQRCTVPSVATRHVEAVDYERRASISGYISPYVTSLDVIVGVSVVFLMLIAVFCLLYTRHSMNHCVKTSIKAPVEYPNCRLREYIE